MRYGLRDLCVARTADAQLDSASSCVLASIFRVRRSRCYVRAPRTVETSTRGGAVVFATCASYARPTHRLIGASVCVRAYRLAT